MQVWQTVAKSVIGTTHSKEGKPCQDFSSYRTECNEKVILGAVSDGMSTAVYSDKGSEIAVKCSLKYLSEQKVWAAEPHESNFRGIFHNLLRHVRYQLTQFAQQYEFLLDELNCTLIVFVATQDWIAAMQVGDGLIVVRSQSQSYQLLFQPDKGEYANETTSVTSVNAEREMLFKVLRIPVDFICAATDGIENVALVKKNWTPHKNFFSGLEEAMLSDKSLQQKEKEVEDFLGSKDLNSRTDDDKTLLLCICFSSAHELTPPSSDLDYPPEPFSDQKELDSMRQYISVLRSNNHRLQRSFWISLFINLLLFILLFWLKFKPWGESTPLTSPTFIDAYQPNNPNPVANLVTAPPHSHFDVWVLTPVEFLDKLDKRLNVPQNKILTIYDGELSKEQIISTIYEPIGILQAGAYEYFDASEVYYSDIDTTVNYPKFRWVKISLQRQEE